MRVPLATFAQKPRGGFFTPSFRQIFARPTAGTRLILFSDDKPDRFFGVIRDSNLESGLNLLLTDNQRAECRCRGTINYPAASSQLFVNAKDDPFLDRSAVGAKGTCLVDDLHF
jgi:hypothetical protein